MDYAALISLKQTIERLLNSSYISITPSSVKLLESANKEIHSLQEVLRKLDRNSASRDSLNASDGKIRQAVCNLEDILETHVSNQFLTDENPPFSFSLNLEKVKNDIVSFRQAVRNVKQAYLDESRKPSSKKDDDFSSKIGFSSINPEIIGFSNELRITFDRLRWFWIEELQAVSLVGMAGIGKTTLAREIFNDPFISDYFKFHAWVTLGPKGEINDVLQGVVAKMNDEVIMETQEELMDYFYRFLKGKRYLIVLDDVWEKSVWLDFKKLFPDEKNASRALITTRLEEVAHDASDPILQITRLPFLNSDDSWHLLRDRVFRDEPCPLELEKAGKKIAENCEGLPLLIVTVAKILSRSERTLQYWNAVAEKKNSVFKDAYDRLSNVLFPSYNYLPQHLKACFLYMGVFPQSHVIPITKLVELWGSEGFLEPNWWNTLEDLSMECAEDLVSRSLVIVRQHSSTGRIKTCGLHSVFWHLCVRVAGKSKFFHVLNSRADGLDEGMNSQLRLCILNNVLFSIKDVYKSMGARCASTSRSLLCSGPFHQYQVPICSDLTLLRVLDALTIRFYEFPVKVLKLTQLRYLGLTCNDNLPGLISKLWNLQFLIIHRHMSIRSSVSPSYLPMEIWDMKELKHLHVTGSNLPIPSDDRQLPNLIKLLDVSSQSCTVEVLQRFPNLKKLGVQIELSLDNAELSSFYDQFSHLHFLESLKCVVVNPNPWSHTFATNAFTSVFPPGLKKLSLSGFGYPWEYMRTVALLPNLEVLKLRCYAFRGLDWETGEGEFLQLKFLLIEDTDLMNWSADKGCFTRLERLVIRHCYKLMEIPSQFKRIRNFISIEIVDCNPSAVACAKEMMKGSDKLKGYIHSSWEN